MQGDRTSGAPAARPLSHACGATTNEAASALLRERANNACLNSDERKSGRNTPPCAEHLAQRGRSVKAWAHWTEALRDHRVFAMCWLRIFDAYVGPNALDAALIEAVMLTVNSVNMCPFCSGLHMECGRVAGLAEPGRLDKARSVDECACLVVSQVHRAAVVYARAFAVSDGRGKREAEAFADLTLAYGSGQAQAVRALCWFLYWGSFTGNTLNGALGEPAMAQLAADQRAHRT